MEHARGEGPYTLGEALAAAGLRMRLCQVWAGDPVPATLTDVDALVVMGGAQAAYSDDGFPSRRAELELLRKALAAEVPVLGICLGAQMLALAAGGTARVGSGLQLGWGEVAFSPEADGDPLLSGTPERLRVLSWHGDTMDLPEKAVLLASCDRYPVQAFRMGGAAWGLQFHLEVDEAAVDAFMETATPQEVAAAPRLREETPGELTVLAPHRDRVFARFAALVADRTELTATRTFFTPRADA
ncbi:type 1 glutamine amidotransferase [Streptomyces bathyalis]|nr:type 1 glutamine amidotransferase [Streptomyces bathyalis]